MNFPTEEVHINSIRVGDTVFHDGHFRTVGRNNLKHCGFMGRSIWGDSYKIGYKPVVRAKGLRH